MGHTPAHQPEHLRKLDSAELINYNQTFTKFFDSLLLKGGFSGGIMVVKNGQVLYENYQGFADAAKRDSINADTRFHVASTSKTFTSTAILQLVNAGKVHLDDSLQVYFPLFPYSGITVRHLLTHSSGLPNYANLFPKYNWDKKKTATNEDVVNFIFFANRPGLEFRTGSKFHYCNTNFVLLALIVERASGKFFPDYVQDSIFTPAGMTHSYVLSQKNAGGYTPSWDGGGRIYDFNELDAIYGDKNVYTTCRDLVKYDSAIRNNLLLPQRWYDSAWTPSFLDRKYNDPIEHYGLGWRLKIFSDSSKIVYHNGWWHGNNAVFQRMVLDTAVIVVTGNRMSNRIYSAAKAANIFRPYYPSVSDEVAEEEQHNANGRNVPAKKTVVPSKKRVKKRR